jgi:hypothetical protein
VHECEMPIAAAAAIATGEKHLRGHALLVPAVAWAEHGCSDRPRPVPSQAFAFRNRLLATASSGEATSVAMRDKRHLKTGRALASDEA